MRAASAANAHGFISAMPRGYHTEVGEGGARLSGGQKQRVAIARAILQNPVVLLLDEATSSLDRQAETHVQAALDVVSRGRTTLTIAHRLSAIRNADKIFVLRDGAVAESGNGRGADGRDNAVTYGAGVSIRSTWDRNESAWVAAGGTLRFSF